MDSTGLEFKASDLRKHFGIVWRRKWFILGFCILAVVATVLATSLLVTPLYQSSAQILQRRSGLDKILLGGDLYQQSFQPDRDIQTAAELVTSPAVSSAVSGELGDRLGGKNPGSIVSVDVVKKADILSISATDADPELAAAVANSFASQYISWRQRVELSGLQNARAPIEAQVLSTPEDQQDTDNFRALRAKLENLKLLESMQNGNFELVMTATPSSDPVSPNPIKNGVIALVLSLFAGVSIAIVLNHFDTRIRHTDEIERIIDKPILSSIPKTHSFQTGRLVTVDLPASASSEAFRLLRTNLSYLEPDKEIKSIMITSPEAGEGKTTTMANLAVTMARNGKRVMALDADLRRPMLSEYMGLNNAIGLTNAISGDKTLKQSLQRIDAKDLAISSDGAGMSGQTENTRSLNGVMPIYCAAAGALPPNPGEIAASDKMTQLITEACQYSDMVLVDSPPLGVVGDAASLATKVDGVIFVVSMGRTRKQSLETMRHFMENVPCNVLGIVLTNTGGKKSYDSYGVHNYSSGY
ncbi:MAG: tyrosine-protein kinase domain-containing protein [Thermoleophilia bacterium]